MVLLTLPGAALSEDDAQFFEQSVRPLLAENCVKCHGPTKQEGDLRLDSREAFLKGGASGSVIDTEDREESLLLSAVRYDGLEMPPEEPLKSHDVEVLVTWVRRGAYWPQHAEPIRVGRTIDAEDRDWWAFRPLSEAPVPKVIDEPWCHNDLDRFVLARLEAAGLTPAPRAEKSVLLRRAYLDLLGVPPTRAEREAFESDESPDAWEKLVDRLLDDPRYGENWGRHWLDVVRYAESDGWNQDAYRPAIWRYRDYVVRAFNEDMPYAQFVAEQLAGDQIPDRSPETLVATGYLRLGIYEYNQRDARGHWNDIMNEMTDVTGDVFLGMGMACARCHDHKFDPLLQTDYFRLRAFFEPIQWRDDMKLATEEDMLRYESERQPWLDATAELRQQIDDLLAPYHEKKWRSTVDKFPLDIQACFNKPVEQRNSWEHQMAYLVDRQFYEEGGGPLKGLSKEDKAKYDQLQEQLKAFDDLKPAEPAKIMVATDFNGPAAPTVIPDRSDVGPIAAGFPTVLRAEPAEDRRRLALAQWIGDEENALTYRVMANRIWQYHFGTGLVSTANDFGTQGQLPTHPELLDWLTRQYIAGGGRAKSLHRMILLSSTWQQSAHHPQAAEQERKDPADSLLWRARIRRLTAEQIRDAMLTVSGEIDKKIGGPSVDGDSKRRSLYIKRLRNTPDKFLHAFDVANGLKSVAERNATTTPTQALFLLNGEYTRQRAAALAKQLLAEPADCRSVLTAAMADCWARQPEGQELRDAAEFLGLALDVPLTSEHADRLTEFCHVLLNSSEFLYFD